MENLRFGALSYLLCSLELPPLIVLTLLICGSEVWTQKPFAAPIPMQGLQWSETRATLDLWTLSDFQVLLIFTAAASVVSQDLLVLKLALDHTFGSQGRPPVERDKTQLTIWKGDDRKTCFFEENGATSTAVIPEEADTPFEGDPVGGPSASGE